MSTTTIRDELKASPPSPSRLASQARTQQEELRRDFENEARAKIATTRLRSG